MPRIVRVITNKSQCSGCLSCASVCTLFNEEMCSLEGSRVRVDLDIFAGDHAIRICRQCKDAACARACPTGSIYRVAEMEIWRVNYDTCSGCRECVAACTFSAMFFDPNIDRVVKCELCGASGQPQCVQACPTGALRTKVVERPAAMS